MKQCNIGGQAVIEGVMMRHEDEVAVAVRRPDGEIEVGKMKFRNPIPNRQVLWYNLS